MLDLPQDVKHVLVAPLNWGLGHASRSTSIINQLLDKNIQVTIASDGLALEFLQKEYPQLNFVSLPSYNVRYDGSSFLQTMTNNAVNILSAIKKEKNLVAKLVKELGVDMIISDSRFGMRTEGIKSVIVSHQLNLIVPYRVLGFAVNSFYKKLLSEFNEVWIPDYEDNRLAGELSSNDLGLTCKYMGPLSSLERRAPDNKNEILIILSGPEPARTVFEEKLTIELSCFENVFLVRGTREESQTTFRNGWKVIDVATREEINNLLCESQIIISRSGYTSIMDYFHLGLSAILIPTPLQTEQEYLANFHDGKNGFVCIKQTELNLLTKIISEKLNVEAI